MRDKGINEIIKEILEKADFLTEEDCRSNDGFFLRLNLDEKRILVDKTQKTSKEELEHFPKIKYNMFYLECTTKLKKNYFENLDALLNILLKMQNIPIINNATLNMIGDETKAIIERMYNLCHYYYIFAIIALINADLSEDKPTEIKLEKVYAEVFKANSEPNPTNPSANNGKNNSVQSSANNQGRNNSVQPSNKPLTNKPLTNNPLTNKPLTNKPLTNKQLTNKPLTNKPLTNNNSVNKRKNSVKA